MPTNSSVKRILSAIEKDQSKVLGVKVNGKEITTKQYIPRAGMLGTKTIPRLTSTKFPQTDHLSPQTHNPSPKYHTLSQILPQPT